MNQDLDIPRGIQDCAEQVSAIIWINEAKGNRKRVHRVDLVCRLLDGLPPPGTDVSDEEVAKREFELDEAQVEELSRDEFVRRVEKERGK